MKNITDILMLLLVLVLPMGLGYFFKAVKVFNDNEITTLRKFVVRVCVPFLIFKNLYKANVSVFDQFVPAAAAFFIMTTLFVVSGFWASFKVSTDNAKQNAFAFAVSMGNYAFLGWGVVHSFYGEDAFTRAVFFTLIFWPVFLFWGFWLVHRKHPENKPESFARMLWRNASVPIISAAVGILMNLWEVPVPGIIGDLIDKFAAFVIPMILFCIGLDFKLKMPGSNLKVVAAASIYRLVGGFAIGLAVLFLTRLVFSVDVLTQKVILIESIMPTATMTVFFVDYTEIDKELLSGTIAISTLLSLVTIPLWYIVVERLIILIN